MHDLNGLIPQLEVAQRARVHEEHLGLGFAAQILRVIAHGGFDGLLRLAHTTLAVGDERQIVKETVHAERGAELTQGQFVIALTVGHERKGLTREINTGSLMRHPLGVFERQLRIPFLKRVGGEDVQADVLRMFLGQATQTLTVIGGQHAPLDALRHLRLARATMRVRVLRREAHRAVGIATRLRQVFTTLRLAVLHLLFTGEFAALLAFRTLVAILVEVTTLVVTAEIPAIAVTTIITTEITTLTITTLAITALPAAVIAAEVSAIAVLVEVAAATTLTIVTAEVTTVTVMTEIATLAIATVIMAETGTLAITLVARIVAAIAAIATATVVTTLAITVELARTVVETTLLAFAFAVAMEIAVATTVSAAIALAISALTVIVVETAGLVSVGLAAVAARLESLATAVTRPARAVGLVVAVGFAARSALFFCHAVPYWS